MKKFAFILASVMLVATVSSCNKSNSDKDGQSGESKRISTKVEVTLSANFNADYFLYADFQVKYPEGGSIKTENLTAPAPNSRSNWTKTLVFTSEADVPFEVVCTPKKDVTYDDTRTKGDIEYVVFNTNAYVAFQIKDFDASGKQVDNTYGSELKKAENKTEGKLDESHGAGADINPNSLAVKKGGEASNNFIESNLVSYKCHYKIVKGADGLTAESAD